LFFGLGFGVGLWMCVGLGVRVRVGVGVREIHFYEVRSGKHLQPEDMILCGYVTRSHRENVVQGFLAEY